MEHLILPQQLEKFKAENLVTILIALYPDGSLAIESGLSIESERKLLYHALHTHCEFEPTERDH